MLSSPNLHIQPGDYKKYAFTETWVDKCFAEFNYSVSEKDAVLATQKYKGVMKGRHQFRRRFSLQPSFLKEEPEEESHHHPK